jgi:nucleoside-diphosphate-sugar epimerase
VASYTATLNFIKSKKPKFSVVMLHPVSVFGHNLLQKISNDHSGTNAMFFGSLYAEEPMFVPLQGVHVVDVAEAHIRSLSLTEAHICSNVLSGEDRSWDDVVDYANNKYPEAGFKAKPKSAGSWAADTSRAEADLGFNSWRGMEKQLSDVVNQQLKLRDNSHR